MKFIVRGIEGEISNRVCFQTTPALGNLDVCFSPSSEKKFSISSLLLDSNLIPLIFIDVLHGGVDG